MSRPATLTILQNNLTKNLETVRNLSRTSRVWACAKAGGYGHGIDSVIRGFANADGLALLEIEEAYEARHLGWNKPLLLLEGVFHERELVETENLKLEVVIHNEEQLDWCIAFDGQFTGIWIKINSGMNRLGFNTSSMNHEKIKKIVEKLNLLRTKVLNKNGLRWLTHFSRADNLDGCDMPAKIFKNSLSLLDYRVGEQVSYSNSAALITHPRFNSDWVRPGILLYGALIQTIHLTKLKKLHKPCSPLKN